MPVAGRIELLIKKTDRIDQSNQLDGMCLISAHYQTASYLERHISGGIFEIVRLTKYLAIPE
jgi:hypothetical protein